MAARTGLHAPFRPFDGRHADAIRRVGSCHSFPAIGQPRCATRGTIYAVRSAMHPERCAHCVCRHIGHLSPLRAFCRRTCREQRFASSTRERRQVRRRENRGACRCATASTGSAGREPYSVSRPFLSTAGLDGTSGISTRNSIVGRLLTFHFCRGYGSRVFGKVKVYAAAYRSSGAGVAG